MKLSMLFLSSKRDLKETIS